MVWFPGDDELPMSLSYTSGDSKGFTVKAMGTTSRNVQGIRVGDRIGIRGPYGNRFNLSARRVLVVGGGSGAAVLAPAAELAAAGGTRLTVALGATRSAELLFRDRFLKMGARVEVATDDGSTPAGSGRMMNGATQAATAITITAQFVTLSATLSRRTRYWIEQTKLIKKNRNAVHAEGTW